MAKLRDLRPEQFRKRRRVRHPHATSHAIDNDVQRGRVLHTQLVNDLESANCDPLALQWLKSCQPERPCGLEACPICRRALQGAFAIAMKRLNFGQQVWTEVLATAASDRYLNGEVSSVKLAKRMAKALGLHAPTRVLLGRVRFFWENEQRPPALNLLVLGPFTDAMEWETYPAISAIAGPHATVEYLPVPVGTFFDRLADIFETSSIAGLDGPRHAVGTSLRRTIGSDLIVHGLRRTGIGGPKLRFKLARGVR